MFKTAGHGCFFTVTFRSCALTSCQKLWGTAESLDLCHSSGGGVDEAWALLFQHLLTLLHLKYQVGLGELSGAITKRRKKPHLCGGCDKLVILYLQIANYSSDWLLSDQFACAVMVTGLQIRCRISCGSDVVFSSCSLGSKMHGWGVLCNSLLLAALFFHSQSFFRLERNKMAHSCSLVVFLFLISDKMM